MSELYDKWLHAYVEAEKDPRSLSASPCPSCGRPALRLLFVVPADDTSVGRAEFWCDHCRKGVFFSRVTVPAHGDFVTMEQRRATPREKVARYEIIPPTVHPG
ncbi:hypothetical protein ACIBF7_43745 [Nonomuraea sp. NPDC050478]|uniref:hypothetical protein n=1 Tax=Nonomuraea sp. NPDC050478 TaxID=3364365 RepID=UPI0037AF63B6